MTCAAAQDLARDPTEPFDAVHRFCRAFDEVRNFLGSASYINQNVSLARRRTIHVQRVAALRDLISVD